METRIESNMTMKTPESGIGWNGFIRLSLARLFVITGVLSVLSSARGAGDEWETKSPMPTARLGLAACAVNGKVYAIGGYPSANLAGLTTVEVYDPVTDTWTTKAPMPTRRRWLSASAVNGRIYAIGGFENQGTPPLPIAEEYDVATDTWSTKAPMSAARMGYSTAVLDGKIYAIGGANVNEQRIASVEMYDPATDTWSPRASMPTARAMFATAVLNGKIYAIGGPWPGDGGIATVEEYDPASDTWTTKPGMPTRRWALTAETIGGKIHAMGGGQRTTGLSVVEEYDPARDSWTAGQNMAYEFLDQQGDLQTMPFGRWGLASAVVDNQIYVMGGASSGPPHPGSDIMIAYTPPAPGIPFANYVRFIPTGPTTADMVFEEGPFPLEFGLPTPVASPMPGWDGNAIGMAAFSEEPPTLDENTFILTIPVHDTMTLIARDTSENERGRIELLAVGSQKADLNANNAVVDEANATIQVQFGGSLLAGEPSAIFSVVEVTGVFATDVHILETGFVGYAGGYFLLPLDDDPNTTLQENILSAFGAGQIVGADLRGVMVGNYVPSPAVGGRLIANGSERLLRLEWPGQDGVQYTIQFKETVDAPEWTDLESFDGAGELLM